MDPNSLTPFLPDFLKAARGNVEQIRSDISSLQANPSDIQTQDRAHIASHSLKGECKAMGFVKTGELARLLEFYFKAMQEGQVALTPDGAQLLVSLLATISSSLDAIEQHQNELDSSNMFQQFVSKTGIA